MKWDWLFHFAVFKIHNNTFERSIFHPFLPVLPPSALTFPCCCAGFSAPKTNSCKSVPTGKAAAEGRSIVLFFCWNPLHLSLWFIWKRHGGGDIRQNKSKPSLCVISRPRMFTSRHRNGKKVGRKFALPQSRGFQIDWGSMKGDFLHFWFYFL